jgi:hypothetical protein
MGQRWIKIVVLTCLILVGVTFFIYDEIHVHAVLNALARDDAGFGLTMDVLRRRNDDLVNEASKWRQQAEEAQKRSSRVPARESLDALAAEAAGLSRDVLDCENEKTVARPATIFSAVAGGEETMRRNSEENGRYDRAAVTEFLKQFGGPVNAIVRKIRPYGLDTSRLQRHIETINNIQVMRLVANDLTDLAEQLKASRPKRPRPAPEPRIALDVRRTAAIGQE